MCVCVLSACVCGCTCQSSCTVTLYHKFWESLSLNLMLVFPAEMNGQWAPRIYLSSLFNLGLTHMAGYAQLVQEDWGVELQSSSFHRKPCYPLSCLFTHLSYDLHRHIASNNIRKQCMLQIISNNMSKC